MTSHAAPEILQKRTVASDAWLRGELRRRFGHESFLPNQIEVVREVIAGHDTLAVMPTGSGKSLCFQLPAVLRPGVTLVVSPLIALMRDQVDKLAEHQRIRATFINSSVAPKERRSRISGMVAGRYDLVYVSPERLAMREFAETAARSHVWLIVVDEAHCISEWGHDFRPAYLQIDRFAQQIGRPPILAATATATERVRRDIIGALRLNDRPPIIGDFDRPNLTYEVWPTKEIEHKIAALQHLLTTEQGSAIIYVGTRRDAEDAAAFCRDELSIRAQPYHGGMDKDQRDEAQGEFASDKLRVVAATCAFGMGIDKPGIRLVLHLAHPGSIEAYYQEAGRAGRDGEPARCVLLYSKTDRRLQEYLIRHGSPTPEQLGNLFATLTSQLDGAEGWVDTERLQEGCGIPRTALRVGISELTQRGVLELLDSRGRRLEIRLLRRALPEGLLADYGRDAERRSRHKHESLSRMIAYCEEDRCRRAAILTHFGQDTSTPQTACCDRCMGTGPPELGPVDKSARSGPVRISAGGFEGWALGDYRTREWREGRSEVGDLVRAFKYHNKREAGNELARRARSLLSEGAIPPVDLCIPVPGTGKDAEEGAAVTLARILAGLGGPPMDATLLHKTRDTRFQKDIWSLAEKEKNVKGAFEVSLPEALRGKHILLLDDLFSSGATMAEAARLLREAGATDVHLLAAARVAFGWRRD